MTNGGIRIGEILVNQGVLSAEQVELIVEEQQHTARPFGDLAERMFGIDPTAVESAWVDQFLETNGTVDLTTLYVDGFSLKAITARQAWQFRLLPLYREDGRLVIATDDSNIVRALNFVTRSINEDVQLVVTSRLQLRHFLARHYPVPKEISDYADRLMASA